MNDDAELLNAIQISANARRFDPLLAESIRLQNEAARRAATTPDTSQLARMGFEREMRGMNDQAAGLAMATSLPQFHPMAQQTYRAGLEAQTPMEMGEGVYMPGMGYVADPFKTQGRLTKALAAQAAAAQHLGTAYGTREHQQATEENAKLQLENQLRHQRATEANAAAHLAIARQNAEMGKIQTIEDAAGNKTLVRIHMTPQGPVALPLTGPGMPVGGAAAGGIGGKPGAETVRQLAGVDAVAPLLDQFETLLKDYNPRDPRDSMSPTKRAQIESVGAQLAINLKEAYALGALTGPDVGILERSVASPGGAHAVYYGREGIQKQIDSVRQNMAGRRTQMESMYPRLGNVPSPYTATPAAPRAPSANPLHNRASSYVPGGL